MAYGQGFYVPFKNTDLVVRKSDIVASKQQRFPQAWSFAKSDKCLCYSHPASKQQRSHKSGHLLSLISTSVIFTKKPWKIQLSNLCMELSRQATNS